MKDDRGKVTTRKDDRGKQPRKMIEEMESGKMKEER